MATTRKSISLPHRVEVKGQRIARVRGFNNSFSAYVAFLIERDDDVLRREREALQGVLTGRPNGKDPAHAG